MAELHKFKDDVKDPKNRAKPISAQKLDDNFRQVRLKVAIDGVSDSIFKIKENYPNNDTLIFSLVPPTGGTYVLGSVDGVLQWLETEDC